MFAKKNEYYFIPLFVFICTSIIGATQAGLNYNFYLSVTGHGNAKGATAIPVPFQPSVLLLVDSRHAPEFRSGGDYPTISRNWFPSLGVGLVEFAVPRDMSRAELVKQLAAKFPSATVAPNESVVPLGTSLPGAAHRWPGSVNDQICVSQERIGIIDGPVNPDHPVFAGHSIVRKSFVNGTARKSDSAHSTAVLSILADTYAQASSQPLSISLAEIFERRDAGVAGSLLSTVRALDWLVREGATVINMSLQSKENPVFSKVLDRVAEAGVIMVAAAGNYRPGLEMNFPAAHPKVLAVTAIDASHTASPYANRGEFIDFAAPGVNIPIATMYGAGRGSGTSYAAPYVTSVVALALTDGAPRDIDGVRQLIAKDATDLGRRGKDDIYGWGLPTVQTKCQPQQHSRR